MGREAAKKVGLNDYEVALLLCALQLYPKYESSTFIQNLNIKHNTDVFDGLALLVQYPWRQCLERVLPFFNFRNGEETVCYGSGITLSMFRYNHVYWRRIISVLVEANIKHFFNLENEYQEEDAHTSVKEWFIMLGAGRGAVNYLPDTLENLLVKWALDRKELRAALKWRKFCVVVGAVKEALGGQDFRKQLATLLNRPDALQVLSQHRTLFHCGASASIEAASNLGMVQL